MIKGGKLGKYILIDNVFWLKLLNGNLTMSCHMADNQYTFFVFGF